MKNSMLYYSVGALLYCPANNESITNSLIHEKFGKKFSLALCLEDTIRDDCVEEAEEKLLKTLTTLSDTKKIKNFFIPQIFIRIRNAAQITSLLERSGDAKELITGFIIPKFSLDNADQYINTISFVNEHTKKKIYMMPILESPSIIDLQNRFHILYQLKEKLKSVEELVLNIRIGGNDLCHMFGFRRHSDESIHTLTPISNIFSDIITVFGMDYIVSGPVFEYYNGEDWESGFIHELKQDRLCGFVGKTVIHPNQIAFVNSTYKVSKKDFEDAKSILNWDDTSHALVSGSTSKERMNEFKTHSNWAMKMMMLAKVYGVKE